MTNLNLQSPDAPSKPPEIPQFRLSSLFLVTLAASILAAFLNPRGQQHMLAGALAVSIAMALGWAIGTISPPRSDRIFWGMVITAMMQAVCAEVILMDPRGVIAWPLCAGVAAVFVASRANIYRRMLVGAAVAAIVILVYTIIIAVPSHVMVPVVACAAIGGALMTVLVEIARWSEMRYRIPQPVVGLTLVIGSIFFSVTASHWIPGW